MLRVWILHRKTGLPYQPLLAAHLELMAVQSEILARQTTMETVIAEAARQAQRN